MSFSYRCWTSETRLKYSSDPYLNAHSLKEVLEQHHLDRVFTDTWTKPSCKEGKMAYCANICGTHSRVDKIYTHEKMEDKNRNWRDMINSKRFSETENNISGNA